MHVKMTPIQAELEEKRLYEEHGGIGQRWLEQEEVASVRSAGTATASSGCGGCLSVNHRLSVDLLIIRQAVGVPQTTSVASLQYVQDTFLYPQLRTTITRGLAALMKSTEKTAIEPTS
ncbi:hypothetical protein TNCV_602701 [Trichonephila clavipes]|nr:hypothetical protein TNCV_602701 [Trichonephila clavipes]